MLQARLSIRASGDRADKDMGSDISFQELKSRVYHFPALRHGEVT